MARVSISPSNRSPLVQIAAWFFFFVGVFFFLVRLVTKRALSSPFKLEDGLISAAIVFSLAQSIAISSSATHGLGKPLKSLSDSQIEDALKAEYASTILFIACLGITKLSIAAFIKGLSPDKRNQQYAVWIAGAVFAYILVGVITSMFQCAPPHTWDLLHGKHCVNLKGWWSFITVFNIFTDVCIVAVQFYIMWGVQLPTKNKIVLLIVFSLRLGVVAATIAQLAFYFQALSSSDITLRAWLPEVLNALVQSSGIATACIPYIKRFMDSMESGMIRVEEPTVSDRSQRGTELKNLSGASATSRGSSRTARQLNTIPP